MSEGRSISVDFRIMGVKARREQYILPMLNSLGMTENIVFYDVDRAKKERNAMQNAKRTWLAPTTADFICVLQDDLELCNNFIDIVYKCAERFPASIFSFYQPRLKKEDACADTPYVKIIGCGMYGQAIMMPVKLVPLVFYWGDKNFGEDYPHDDTVIGFFAKVNNISVMATNPCIVQHLGHSNSQLGYNNKNKISSVYQKDIDASLFDTDKFVKSKTIPNTEIPPKGGYLLGSLRKLTEM